MVELVYALAIQGAAREGGIAVDADGERAAGRGIADVAIPGGIELRRQQMAMILVAHVGEDQQRLRDGEAGVVLGRVENGQELRIGHVIVVVRPKPRAANDAAEIDAGAVRRGGRRTRSGRCTCRCGRARRGRGAGRTTVQRAQDGTDEFVDGDLSVAVQITSASAGGTAVERLADEEDELADHDLAVAVEISGTWLGGAAGADQKGDRERRKPQRSTPPPPSHAIQSPRLPRRAEHMPCQRLG
jgi:hypothetical protein